MTTTTEYAGIQNAIDALEATMDRIDASATVVPGYVEQSAGRQMTAEIGRLEDKASMLRAAGNLTAEIEDGIRGQIQMAVARYQNAIAEGSA